MQKRKAVETRQTEVYAIIVEIIAEQGVAYVSTKVVAERLGVSQPALYKYFKNRDEMLAGFLDYVSSLLEEILEQVNRFETSEDKLSALYREQLGLIEKTKVLPKVLFFEEFHTDTGSKGKKFRELVRTYEQGVKAIVVEGINRREIAQVDPDIAVQFIKGVLLSSYLNWTLADMDYSLVNEQEKFTLFLKQSILK